MASLGKSFKLDRDGDLSVITNDHGGIEFEMVEGAHEVAQALVIRMRTRRGEDPLARDVGMPIYDILGLMRPQLIQTVIRSELKKEGRVAIVGNVEAGFSSDDGRFTRSIEALAEVQLIDSTILGIFETYQT